MNLRHPCFDRKILSAIQLDTSIPHKMIAKLANQGQQRQFWTLALARDAVAIATLVLATAVTQALANTPAQAETVSQQLAQRRDETPAKSETTQLLVNPTTGNDTTGNGSDRTPFKTITQALRVAGPNTAIVLAPGTYSEETGETFPIALKPGVTIQGDPASKGRNIIIKGGGLFISPTFARQNIAILGADKAGITGVTVTNTNRRGYGLWIESSSPVVTDNTFIGNSHDGISVTGNSATLIRNNYFAENGANGITIYNTSRPEVRENVFEKTGFGINIGQNAAPLLVGNRITENLDGIVVQNKAQPVLRGNTIEGNSRDGIVAIGEARPDLGTAQQPGGNIFRNNRRLDINGKTSSQTIPAFGNQLARNRTTGRLDLAGTAPLDPTPVEVTASGRVQSPPTVISPILSSRETRSTNSFPSNAAVEIPVPPPAAQPVQVNQTQPRVQRRDSRTLPVLPSTTQTGALEITSSIPTPESQRASQPLPSFPSTTEEGTGGNFGSVQPVRQSRGTLPNPGVEAGLLPVPGSEIPMANADNNLPMVPISQDNPRQQQRRYATPPTPRSVPNRAVALGLRYRVVVEAENPRQQRLVRSIVPGAFQTRANGRVMMQVGAYSDRQEAEEMLQKINSNGLTGAIEELQL
ncbi:DUF1565 domain-containing protein [Argonema galeatum]|uniref:DUF1565 domain-containing protein n=1 Tax=Argonema galeatum TaxID=2942762 RepID=UPI0020117F87|nr:DUF1565 domain-containing protein [Argonema galeatum A003/A1]